MTPYNDGSETAAQIFEDREQLQRSLVAAETRAEDAETECERLRERLAKFETPTDKLREADMWRVRHVHNCCPWCRGEMVDHAVEPCLWPGHAVADAVPKLVDGATRYVAAHKTCRCSEYPHNMRCLTCVFKAALAAAKIGEKEK